MLKTLQAFEVGQVKCSFFWITSSRHCINGARRFETAWWSHLPGSTFIRHSTLEYDSNKQSRNVRYQSHGEAETNLKSPETSSAEVNVETRERNEKGLRIDENYQVPVFVETASFYQTKQNYVIGVGSAHENTRVYTASFAKPQETRKPRRRQVNIYYKCGLQKREMYYMKGAQRTWQKNGEHL